MAIDLWNDVGVPLERQTFCWRDLAAEPLGKLEQHAFTRLRILLMASIECQASRLLRPSALAPLSLVPDDVRSAIADVRRIEHFQQTSVQWLLAADHAPPEVAVAFEQLAVEFMAAIARVEPSPALAAVHRFALLEDLDHLYRFVALLDRLAGHDADVILQGLTDVRPGRPTTIEHRAPVDEIRAPYDRATTAFESKLYALTVFDTESMTRDFYMNAGPAFADGLARQLYAEIAAVEDGHIVQFASLPDPAESAVERWLLHEACEVYHYACCVEHETHPRMRALWARFLDYELGHLDAARRALQRVEKRDPASILPRHLPAILPHQPQRHFIRDVLEREAGFRARGAVIGDVEESPATLAARRQLNGRGSPAEVIAKDYRYIVGTELSLLTEEKPAHLHHDDPWGRT